MRKVLVIDDEKNIRLQLSGLLADEGFAALTAPDAEAGLETLAEEDPDLLLMDVMLPGADGITTLEKLRESGSTLPVIVMSGQATVETAVRATKLGAFDYLEKPLDPERLLLTVRNALEQGRLARSNLELRERIGTATDGLVGSGPAMTALREEIGRAAASHARVLVTGENGTGKELVARALHEGSARASGPFVKVNCAAIPKDLIESELFGHEKGAFTGANARKIGKIEAADGGTLLLDEVGDMALEAQAKLLRVLEENELERVGGNRTIPVDVRVVAATNKDLPRAIADGEFREDLYYRLNVVPLRVPALRERPEDIDELTDHFRESLTGETGRPAREFDDGARATLRGWSWPGNVRELRNAVERLEIMTDGDVITADDVGPVLERSPGGPAAGDALAVADPGGGTLREILDRTERQAIERALTAAQGVISEAARQLGMDRANLHRKMRRLEIERPGGEDDEVAAPAEDVSG